jgi:hypothetical protein
VNPHRLGRLYRGKDHLPDGDRAQYLLERLDDLQGAGWRLVWTVHNLYPVNADGATDLDRQVARYLDWIADALITYTAADAAYLAVLRWRGPVIAAGSAG